MIDTIDDAVLTIRHILMDCRIYVADIAYTSGSGLCSCVYALFSLYDA